ncbi:sulfide dehydrogenase (Flavoprotein) subunit SudA, partial [Candidatus Magnetomorum sp. HK-1]
NLLIGKTLDLNDLKKMGFKAVFIGSGAGLPKFMNLPGEDLNGVYSANEYLTRINLMKAYQFPLYDTPIKKANKIAVIGGGNVAMDAARTALRLGAEKVILIYRRTEKEMPARKEEVEHAKEEGIKFMMQTNPLEFIGDTIIKQIKCIKMTMDKTTDASGRSCPKAIPNSEFLLDVDQAIIALGTTPNPIIGQAHKELKKNPNGTLLVDDTYMTSIPSIFAGGDVVTGAATVITALAAGQKAASAIIKYTKKRIN